MGRCSTGALRHLGKSVYRRYIDLLSDDSPSTVLETQYADIETFSFEEMGAELGLSPIRETPDEAEPAARGRIKGKGKARGPVGAGVGARAKSRALPRTRGQRRRRVRMSRRGGQSGPCGKMSRLRRPGSV